MSLRRQPLRHGQRQTIESDVELLRLCEREIRLLISNKVTKRWIQVGLCLGLSTDVLDVIGMNHPFDVERCELEMIRTWLNNDEEASWNKFAQAVGSPAGGRNSSLAADIIDKAYNSDSDTGGLSSKHPIKYKKYVH